MTPPPMEAATERMTPRKPELVPMIMGTWPPMGPMEKSCTKVTSPATSMAFWSRVTYRAWLSATMPQAPQMMMRGVRFPTNMASTCWIPRGMACLSGIRPLNSYGLV